MSLENGLRTYPQGRFGWNFINPDGVQLLKLHGSVDWRSKKVMRRGGMYVKQFSGGFDPALDTPSGEPGLLLGNWKGKLDAEGPYLPMLKQLWAWLHRANEVFVVGYSFRDEHINSRLRQWVTYNGGRITIVDPAGLASGTDSQTDFQMMLNRFVRRHDPDRVRVIKETAAVGIASILHD